MRPLVENFPFLSIFLAIVAGILCATLRRGALAYRLTLAVGLVVACTVYGFYALFSRGEL